MLHVFSNWQLSAGVICLATFMFAYVACLPLTDNCLCCCFMAYKNYFWKWWMSVFDICQQCRCYLFYNSYLCRCCVSYPVSDWQLSVQVLGICVRTQADNTSIASIKVPSIEDARYAISQFHRRKIGYKRINVALIDDRDQAPAESTRYMFW